jgi:transposase
MGVGPTALRRWVEQLRSERGGTTPLRSKAMTPEQKRIQDLEAQVRRLEREKEILKNCLPGAPRPTGLETRPLH